MERVMLRLLANDIRLNAVWFAWIFVLLNISIVLGFIGYNYPHRYLSIEVGISYITLMPLVLFWREEYYKGEVVRRSIPVSHIQRVLARYISVVLLGIAPVLYGYLYQFLIELLGPHGSLSFYAEQMESGYATEHSLIARGLALTLAFAVIVPLTMRFGAIRVLGVYLVLLIVWSRVIDFFLNFSLHAVMFLGLSRWFFFVSLLVIVCIMVSVWISLHLVRRRDL
jgi:hypothetical protein